MELSREVRYGSLLMFNTRKAMRDNGTVRKLCASCDVWYVHVLLTAGMFTGMNASCNNLCSLSIPENVEKKQTKEIHEVRCISEYESY